MRSRWSPPPGRYFLWGRYRSGNPLFPRFHGDPYAASYSPMYPVKDNLTSLQYFLPCFILVPQITTPCRAMLLTHRASDIDYPSNSHRPGHSYHADIAFQRFAISQRFSFGPPRIISSPRQFCRPIVDPHCVRIGFSDRRFATRHAQRTRALAFQLQLLNQIERTQAFLLANFSARSTSLRAVSLLSSSTLTHEVDVEITTGRILLARTPKHTTPRAFMIARTVFPALLSSRASAYGRERSIRMQTRRSPRLNIPLVTHY